MLRDDLPVALEQTELSLRLATEMGTPFPQALTHLSMAQLLHARGKVDEAAGHLANALAIARRVHSGMLQFMGFLTKAHMALDGKDRAGALESLRRAMSLGRERGYINTSWWRRSVMARLCTEALAAGIEVQYVQRLVRKRALVPDTPPLHVEQWPWALRVYTLGEFRLVRDEQPLRFSRKVQQKPLAMLRAIIAFGGRDVPQEELADALWPEAEGDAAHRAFATTLHRLRQVAGNEKLVQLQGGLVGLDPRFCWVDSWAFESLLAQAGAAEKRGEVEVAAGLTGKALTLYRGAFLAGGNLPSWALSTSERLRGLFLRHTGKLGAWEERTGNWRKAVECYEKALEIDDLAEDFYQRLMSCYLQLGRRAEGLAVYERCRKVLAARLGIDPSPETESLRLALRQR